MENKDMLTREFELKQPNDNKIDLEIERELSKKEEKSSLEREAEVDAKKPTDARVDAEIEAVLSGKNKEKDMLTKEFELEQKNDSKIDLQIEKEI